MTGPTRGPWTCHTDACTATGDGTTGTFHDHYLTNHYRPAARTSWRDRPLRPITGGLPAATLVDDRAVASGKRRANPATSLAAREAEAARQARNHIRGAERACIITAIRAAANSDHGIVNPNRVRRMLAGKVTPQLVGQVYKDLAKAGALERLSQHEWEISDDHDGGNAGKPAPTYRLHAERLAS